MSKITLFIVGVVIGLAIAGAGCAIYIWSDISRVGQLTVQLDASRRDNLKLAELQQSERAALIRTEAELGDLQRENSNITADNARIIELERGEREALKRAKSIIGQQLGSIDKIRQLTKVLEAYFNSGK